MNQPDDGQNDYRQGLPDHHDPLAGVGGAPPAYSALTLRLVLAIFGLLVCGIGGVALVVLPGVRWLGAVLIVLALVAVVDIVVVVKRKRRGEPG
jgi:hypothetical protein